MQKAVFGLAAFGLVALQAIGADYPNYQGPQGPVNGWYQSGRFPYAQQNPNSGGWGPVTAAPTSGTAVMGSPNPNSGGWGPVMAAPMPTPMMPTPMANCGWANNCYPRHEYDVLERLKDFLCFRPTVPCEFWLRTTCYVPPTYTMFPPCCHANGCDCASCFGGRPHLFRTARSGCGPSCNAGYMPMANGCPVNGMPQTTPEIGWSPMTVASQPANRPTSVAYTKPPATVAFSKPAEIFAPVTQQAMVSPLQKTNGTFVPTWLPQQQTPRSAIVPTTTSSSIPFTPASYYQPPRQ